MCKSSFNISFIHHIILFTVQDQHGLQSQSRHWENCWLEIISPELMCVFLISLTSISKFQSKGQLLFDVTGNNSFLLCSRYLAQAAWKSLNWNPVFKIFFDQPHYHHITRLIYFTRERSRRFAAIKIMFACHKHIEETPPTNTSNAKKQSCIYCLMWCIINWIFKQLKVHISEGL